MWAPYQVDVVPVASPGHRKVIEHDATDLGDERSQHYSVRRLYVHTQEKRASLHWKHVRIKMLSPIARARLMMSWLPP